MSADLKKAVREFYLSDEVSRCKAGLKDKKSVKENGKRHNELV